MTTIGDIHQDTRLEPDPLTPGRFRADIPEAWKVFYAFGGVTMATALRAAEEAVSRPDLGLVATSATFAAPVPCGPVICDVGVMRAGKRAAQATTILSEGGHSSAALALTATYGTRAADWEPITFTGLTYPDDCPPPESCPDRIEPPDEATFPRVPFHDQLEMRPAVGHPTWEDGWEPAEARAASWMRFVAPPVDEEGRWAGWSLAVPADSLGWAVVQRVGPGAGPFLVLSLQIDLHVFSVPETDWILQDVRAQNASDGYATGTVDLWDERRRLIARATQTAMLRPFRGT